MFVIIAIYLLYARSTCRMADVCRYGFVLCFRER